MSSHSCKWTYAIIHFPKCFYKILKRQTKIFLHFTIKIYMNIITALVSRGWKQVMIDGRELSLERLRF